MSETVIAALIAGGVTLVVCLLNNMFQQRRVTNTVAEQQKQSASLLEYKIDELTRKVEKHNNLVERMYRIEEVATLYEEKMRVANHRISDLEKHIGTEEHCHE